jgi:hypothetical protein
MSAAMILGYVENKTVGRKPLDAGDEAAQLAL